MKTREAGCAYVFVAVVALLLSLLYAGAPAPAAAQSPESYTDLYDFGRTLTGPKQPGGPGASPEAGVTVDSRGNVFGTTSGGGANGGGIVWELTSSGDLKDLHDFGGTVTNANGTSGPDGDAPQASVTFDSHGNMCGTTTQGGAHYYRGMVWELTSSGAYKDLHDFGGTVINANGSSGRDGDTPLGGVTFDSLGDMYGTTGAGGPYSDGNVGGMVWEIAASGVYKDLHDFGGTVIDANGAIGPDGENPEVGATIDSQGDVCGATDQGGPHKEGTIWELTSSGIYEDLHDFGGVVAAADGSIKPDGYLSSRVAFDSRGNMYGAAGAGGPYDGDLGGDGMIWELTTSGIYRDLHDFGGTAVNAAGTSGPDGSDPIGGVAFDSQGNMYGTAAERGAFFDIASDGGGMVWELSAAGAYRDLHAFGGTAANANGFGGPDGVGAHYGVTLGSDGNLYGTTEQGGAFGDGIAWELALSTSGAAPAVASVTLSPATVIAGAQTIGTVSLGSQAEADTTINLSSSTQDATVPSSVVVPIGDSSVAFSVATEAAASTVRATIKATLGASSSSARLKIEPAIRSLAVSPASVVGGADSMGTVTLAAASLTDTTITLSSSNSDAEIAGSVVVPAGQISATFAVATTPVAANTVAVIKASVGASTKSASLTIKAPR